MFQRKGFLSHGNANILDENVHSLSVTFTDIFFIEKMIKKKKKRKKEKKKRKKKRKKKKKKREKRAKEKAQKKEKKKRTVFITYLKKLIFLFI